MKVAVYNKEGKETGRQVELPASVFGLEAPSDHAIWQDVRNILANKRQGTHKAKERGEVSGSTKKPFKQKGTGGARAGHKRSPLWRHGGRVFGPRPHSYGFKINAKLKSLARRSALTYKAREAAITVIENFSMDAPKTKDFLKVLSNLKAGDRKVLLLLNGDNRNVYLSSRNIPSAKVVAASDANTYDILHADTLIIMEGGLELINAKLGN
jgi:large subunit ribosomal protein L4